MQVTQRIFKPGAGSSLWVLYGTKSGGLGIEKVRLSSAGHHDIAHYLGRYPPQLPSLEVSAMDWANLESIARTWGQLEA